MDSNQRIRAAALFVDELTFKIVADCDVDSDCVVAKLLYMDRAGGQAHYPREPVEKQASQAAPSRG